ncbi:MAG: FeoA family protein [Janthinobacterium lividum]
MTDAISATQERTANLAMLKKGDSAVVTRLVSGADEESAAVMLRLIELGFCPGERVRVLAESFPGGDPMAIRVGNSTFALRRHEAAMVCIDAPAR